METTHPLASAIKAMAHGRWLDPDGSWERVLPWRDGVYGIACFTGRAFIAAPEHFSDADIDALGADGFGGAADPRLIATLAGPDGWIDCLDVLLVAQSQHKQRPYQLELVERPDLAQHPRVTYARRIRSGIRAFGPTDPDDRSLVTHGYGVAGLDEMSYELDPRHRGRGAAAALAGAALDVLPHGDYVLASVAPGNAASLRTLIRVGFTPIGSIQLFTTA